MPRPRDSVGEEPERADAAGPDVGEAATVVGDVGEVGGEVGDAPAVTVSVEGGGPVADAGDPHEPPTAAGSDHAMPAPPAVEPISADVDVAAEASPLPGVHRGGFSRLPTAPVDVTVQSAPAEPGGEYAPAEWAPLEDAPLQRGLSAWALAFAIVGLVVSLFVGWGIPIGLVAVVIAIIALRRPLESRAVAVWALVLGVVSILYSAGWLAFAALRADLFG